MFSYEFFYLPAKYLNYSDFAQFVSEIKYVSSYEGISIESPAREYLKNKIVILARKNGKTVAYRFAEFIKVPKNMQLLFIYDTVSTPAIFKKDISYDMLYALVKNLVLRFRIFENTYVCCINDNFFDVQRFENDFLDVYPSITQPSTTVTKHRYAIEYLITNRMDILGIYDTSEVDRETYFINNERLIQIGKMNTLKCMSNMLKNKSLKKSGQQFLTPNKDANIA